MKTEKPVERDMLRGHLEALVLAVLDRGDAHGYEVLQRLRDLSCDALQLKEGTLYPALYRLEEAGMVKARWESAKTDKPGPRRRIYRITKRGKGKLAADRNEWTRFTAIVGRIMEAAT